MTLVRLLLLGLWGISGVWTQDTASTMVNILNEILLLKNAVTQLKEDVKKLQEGQPKIAFTAALGPLGAEGLIGPLEEDTTLTFSHVQTSIGEGFNPQTGVFTAPLKGVYFFAINCFAWGSNAMSAALYKNEEHVVSVWDEPAPEDPRDNGFNAATVLLEPGDRVFVRLWKNTHISIEDKHSTFSGFLLYRL